MGESKGIRVYNPETGTNFLVHDYEVKSYADDGYLIGNKAAEYIGNAVKVVKDIVTPVGNSTYAPTPIGQPVMAPLPVVDPLSSQIMTPTQTVSNPLASLSGGGSLDQYIALGGLLLILSTILGLFKRG